MSEQDMPAAAATPMPSGMKVSSGGAHGIRIQNHDDVIARLKAEKKALREALAKIAATERRNLTPSNRLALIYKFADEALSSLDAPHD